jgi:hypothetical protein
LGIILRRVLVEKTFSFPQASLTVENSLLVLAVGAKAEADAARMDTTARENFILKYKCVGRMQNK